MKNLLFIIAIMIPTFCFGQKISDFTFGFIGDSQVAVTKGAMPMTVAEDLGIDIEFYGQSCAYARHYLNTAPVIKKHIGYSNVEEINTKNACDVYPYVLGKKYDYVIIALGHNGTLDLQKLVDDIKAHGAIPVMVKMFPIKKKPDMRDQYDGMTADIVLDLTEFTVDSGKDGIHPPKEEMVRVGHEIARQLGDYFRSKGYIITPAEMANVGYVKAKYGDTLETIATANGLTQEDIYHLNPNMKDVPYNYELHPREIVRVK